MIRIYNETKTPWNINSQWKLAEGSSRALMITRNKQYIKAGTVKKQRGIKTISYSNLITEEIQNELSKMVNMKTPQVLFDKNTEVRFSKKDLTSIITTSNVTKKDIYLISLNLQGREVVGVSDSLMLEYLLLGGEFSLIVAIKPNTRFRIYLYNKETNRTEKYVFTSDKDGKTTLNIMSINEEVAKRPIFNIKRFRPAKPTHLILGRESNKEKMLATYATHEIVTFNDNNLETVLETVIKNKYRAITLFDVENEIVEIAKKKFNNVFAIDCLGNIYKIKQ